MELRHLKYFIAVAEELHFGKAAERLNISQPPLSQQIKQLESRLNTTLFNRTNRYVELTEAGEVFYEHALKIINKVKIAYDETQSYGYGESGRLTIGFTGTAAFRILPNIVKLNREYNPNISIQLIQLTTSQQIVALEKRQIDIGILVPPIENKNIITKKIQTEEYVVCLPENHRLANEEEINVSDLKEDSFILTSRSAGIGYYDTVFEIFKDANFKPKLSQIANDQLTMVSFVAAGLGVVILPKSAISIKINGVIYKKLNKTYKKINALAWIIDNNRPVVKTFLNLLNDHILSNTQK